MDWNKYILCVDDDEGILDAYTRALPTHRSADATDDLLARRHRRKQDDTTAAVDTGENTTYHIVTAGSGEEAVEIVRNLLTQGKQFAVGFFDMIMPGGIDGLETIQRIRQLDPQILCAVVTAYTDRSPDQIGRIFPRRNDWLYFNKPFTSGELIQTAHHLVAAWNQRRKEEALFSNLEMIKKGLLSILETVRDINSVPPLVMDSLFEGVLDHYLRLLEATDGFLVIYIDQLQPYQLGRGKFHEHHDFSIPAFAPQWALAEQAISRKMAIVQGTMAAACLKKDDSVLGVLVVESDEPIRQDPMLLETFTAQSISMIEYSRFITDLGVRNLDLSKRNRELMDLFQKLSNVEQLQEEYQQMSTLDFLTGVLTRQALETRFQEELSRCNRHGLSLACLLLDIDSFQLVNERNGKIAGDYVLREIASLLSEKKRPYDVIARYGHDEFVVIFKHIGPDSARAVADRLRIAVEKHTFFFDGKIIKITVSIGVAALKPSADASMESIMAIAHEALGQARMEGPNHCVFLGDDS